MEDSRITRNMSTVNWPFNFPESFSSFRSAHRQHSRNYVLPLKLFVCVIYCYKIAQPHSPHSPHSASINLLNSLVSLLNVLLQRLKQTEGRTTLKESGHFWSLSMFSINKCVFNWWEGRIFDACWTQDARGDYKRIIGFAQNLPFVRVGLCPITYLVSQSVSYKPSSPRGAFLLCCQTFKYTPSVNVVGDRVDVETRSGTPLNNITVHSITWNRVPFHSRQSADSSLTIRGAQLLEIKVFGLISYWVLKRKVRHHCLATNCNIPN